MNQLKSWLNCEQLETREVPAVYDWVYAGTGYGDGSDVNNWRVGGQVPAAAPTSTDKLVFGAGDGNCLLHLSTVKDMDCTGAADTFAVKREGALTFTGTVVLEDSMINVNDANLTFEGTLSSDGGKTQVLNATADRTLSFEGGSTFNCSGFSTSFDTDNAGTVKLLEDSYILIGGRDFLNYGTLKLEGGTLWSASAAAAMINEPTTGLVTVPSGKTGVIDVAFINYGALENRGTLTLSGEWLDEDRGIICLISEGVINLYGGSQTTLNYNVFIEDGGTLEACFETGNNNHEVKILGQKEIHLGNFTELWLGYTFGHSLGHARIWINSNSDFYFHSGSTMKVILNYAEGETGWVNKLVCNSVVYDSGNSGTLIVERVNVPATPPDRVWQVIAASHTNEFATYTHPGLTHEWVNAGTYKGLWLKSGTGQVPQE